MTSEPRERGRRTAFGRVDWAGLATGVFGLGILSAPLLTTARGLTAAALDADFSSGSGVAAWLLLAVGFLVVIFLNALFVAGGAALAELKVTHVKAHEPETRTYLALSGLLDRRPICIAACVLGAHTMSAWLILLCFAPSSALARALGWQVGAATMLGAAVLLSVPLVGVNVIVGELIAKAYASLHPHRVALRLSAFIRFFSVVFYVPSLVATRLAGLATRRFGAKATFGTVSEAEEEIREILESTEGTGEIETEEREMLHSVFEFGDTVAREVMTPRVDVESVPISTQVDELTRLIEETGHSRFPVFESSDDEIVGIVHAKDVLRMISLGKTETPVSDIMRAAVFVPENKSLHDLLREMRVARSQMVVVQDEFGGTAGIVTVEDIVEEVVGEIVDEYDPELVPIQETAHGHVVEGKLHLDDLNEAIGSDFASAEFDTIGGYVFGLFGRQPKEGESVESDGYRFTVAETDGRRISTIRVERTEAAMPEEVLTEPAG